MNSWYSQILKKITPYYLKIVIVRIFVCLFVYLLSLLLLLLLLFFKIECLIKTTIRTILEGINNGHYRNNWKIFLHSFKIIIFKRWLCFSLLRIFSKLPSADHKTSNINSAHYNMICNV